MDADGSEHCDWMERMSRLRPFPTRMSEHLETLDVLTHEQSQMILRRILMSAFLREGNRVNDTCGEVSHVTLLWKGMGIESYEMDEISHKNNHRRGGHYHQHAL
jgi:hypothetical protein